MDRKLILTQYASVIDAEGLFIKTLDQMVSATVKFEPEITDFLTPDVTAAMERIAVFHTELKVLRWGIFEEAERVKLVFCPDFMEENELNPSDYIALLDIKYDQKFNKLEHRDAFGALMASGVKRNRLGDIIVYEGGFQVAVDRSLVEYFCHNLDKIGRSGVQCVEIHPEQAIRIERATQEVTGTVKSIRLDSIIALAYDLSRSESQSLVEHGFVKVNHIVIEKAGFVPKEKDLISVRGHGRFTIDEILGTTKKDRTRVRLQLIV